MPTPAVTPTTTAMARTVWLRRAKDWLPGIGLGLVGYDGAERFDQCLSDRRAQMRDEPRGRGCRLVCDRSADPDRKRIAPVGDGLRCRGDAVERNGGEIEPLRAQLQQRHHG